MKLRGLVTGLIILYLCMPTTILAQPRTSPPDLSPCVPLQPLGLSPEQERAVADIDRSFQGQLHDLRSRLLAKRLEFKAALGNPQADEQMIKTKAKELRHLWSQCQQTTTDYYLKIKSVLTPEQRQKWFSATNPCFPRNLGREP